MSNEASETTYKTTTRELEWFDLETRMRELLHEHLAPLISRGNSDRESHTELQKAHLESVERVKRLETFVFGDSEGESIISDLRRSMEEIETNRRSDRVSFEQDCSLLKEKINGFNFQMAGFTDMTKRLEELHQQTTTDISSIHSLIESHQELVVKEIDSLNQSFKQMNSTYTEIAVKTDETAQRALNKGEANETTLAAYRVELDNFSKEVDNARTDIRRLFAEKTDLEHFRNAKDSIYKLIDSLKADIYQINVDIKNRDAFLDKQFPLRIACMISDSVYSFIDSFGARKFADFEDKMFATLNSNTLTDTIDTRGEAFQKITDRLKETELRTANIMSQLPIKAPVKEKKTKKTRVEETKPPEFSIDIPQMLENFLYSSVVPLVNACEERLAGKIKPQEVPKKLVNAEYEAFIHELIGKVDDLEQKVNRERGSTLILINDNKERIEKYFRRSESLEDSFKNMSLMLVCLVENVQIIQALETQSEKDRPKSDTPFESMNRSTMTPISFNKNGLTTPIKTGYSPLYYRSQRFQRLELVTLMGRMLELCWERTSKNLPWSKAAFENIIVEAAKNKTEDTMSAPRRRKSQIPRRYKPF